MLVNLLISGLILSADFERNDHYVPYRILILIQAEVLYLVVAYGDTDVATLVRLIATEVTEDAHGSIVRKRHLLTLGEADLLVT